LPHPTSGIQAEVELGRQGSVAGKLEACALGAYVAHDAGDGCMVVRQDLRALKTLCPRKASPVLHDQPPMKIFVAICFSLDLFRLSKCDRI